MKITKNKIIACALILIVLAATFWYGGDAPGLQGWNVYNGSSDPASADAAVDKNEVQEPFSSDKDKEVSPINSSEEPTSNHKSDGNKKNDNVENIEATVETLETEDSTHTKQEEKPVGIESRPEGIEGGLSDRKSTRLNSSHL